MRHLNLTKKKKLSKYKKILAVVLARGNSKGVKNKNLLKINNKTLIEIAIENAKKSKKITKLVFSSDNNKLIKIAKRKIKIHFKRPKKLATNKSSTFDVLKHAAKWLEKNESWKPDIIVALPPTTPFRNFKHIDNTINLLNNTKAQAAITITEPSYSPYWMFKKEKGNYKFLISSGKNIQRRQDAPKTYQPAGMVYALRRNFLFNMKGILPQNNTVGLFVKKEEAINIDSELDYKMAKMIAKKTK